MSLLCVTDRWLAGYLTATGSEQADVPVTAHEKGKATAYYRFIASQEYRTVTIINAWYACCAGKEAFDAYLDKLRNPEQPTRPEEIAANLAAADLAATHYSAIVMAERWRRAADKAHCRVIRFGKNVATVPVEYSRETAAKLGLPYPPPPLKQA